MGHFEEGINVLPLNDLRQSICSRNEVEICIRIDTFEITQSIDRVGRSTAVDIDPGHRETRVRCGCNYRHQIAMFRRSDPPTRFERLHCGRDKNDLIELEDIHNLGCSHEVPVVDGVKGAAHDPD